MMKRFWAWFVVNLCRWLPHATEPGLRKIGNPNHDSPVIVTSNFSLTVKRVIKAIKGQNLWLLVANSEGINVWCAAAGGVFTENRIIDAIKVTGLADKVKHREIILPPLSAPGMDLKAIKKETGFYARFGPVYADDIQTYLDGNNQKTEAMGWFNFDLKHRLDMILSMNFPVWAGLVIILAIFWPQYLLDTTILFWTAIAILYLFINFIPGRTGWSKALFSASIFIGVWAVIDWYLLKNPLEHWGWFIATYLLFLSAGFDLAGIASNRKSDPEQLMLKLGIKSLGSLFNEKSLGNLSMEPDACIGCMCCKSICPIGGVFGEPNAEKKMTIKDSARCFACCACIKQCPVNTLKLI